MPLLTRSRISIMLFVVAFLAVNALALRWTSHFFSAEQQDRSFLRYGDRAPALKGKSLLGKGAVELSTENPTNLILYLSSLKSFDFSTELVKSAEILSRRHKKDGLAIAAIVPQDMPELQSLIDRSFITYEVIVDENQQIQRQLGLESGENGVFVFDQEGRCRFSTRQSVNAGDLRQLVAMEFLKVDPFEMPAESETVLKEGSSLGAWPLLDARSLAKTSMDKVLAGTGVLARYVFFTADCSVCSLPEYLKDLKRLQRDQLNDKDHAVLIFDYNFSTTDVLQQLKANSIDSPAYIANEQLPELQFTDRGHSHGEKTVAIVQTDAQRKVLTISPLNSHMAQQRGAATKAGTRSSSSNLAFERVFNDIPFTAYDVATYQGKYFLTDFDGHRILIVNDSQKVEKDFGRIGSGPGRLFHPGYLDIGRDGTIFVQDGGNERIVKFDQAGNYLGEFRVGDYQGLAVGPQNELYLGQPEEGSLITVYSSAGKKLRSFGQLKKFSEIHGGAFSDQDVPYKIAFNRVRLSTDKDGNLYVSFMLTPLIQKYNPDGSLLFEKRMQAPEIDRLMEAIQKKKYIATKSDGADARILALDPVVDPVTGNIMVPLVDGSVYFANREGNRLTLVRPENTPLADGTFYPFIAGIGAKGELLVTPMPPKHWYRLALPVDNTSALSGSQSTAATK